MFGKKNQAPAQAQDAPIRRGNVDAIKHSSSADAAWNALFNNGATKAEKERALTELKADKRVRDVAHSASRPGRDDDMARRMRGLLG